MSCFLCSCWFYVLGAIILYKVLDYLVRLPKVGNLQNKYVLVTGADTGFGNEISKRLDKMGCNVFAGCLTEKGEDDLRKSCSSRMKPIVMNVASHDSVVEAYEKVKSMLPHGKGLWGIFNNAGIAGKIGPAEWLTLDDYTEVINVNLLGLIDTTVTFLPLVKKEKGRIINTASVFGRFTIIGSTPYTTSKYGVESFSDSLRRMMRPFKVTVHLIEPGFHKTNITNTSRLESAIRQSWNQAPQESKDEYGEDYLDKSINKILESVVSGVISDHVSDVIDAYEHALLGKYPRARYVVGKDAKFLWLPLQWLPEWLGDFLLDKLAKDKPIPRACRN